MLSPPYWVYKLYYVLCLLVINSSFSKVGVHFHTGREINVKCPGFIFMEEVLVENLQVIEKEIHVCLSSKQEKKGSIGSLKQFKGRFFRY